MSLNLRAQTLTKEAANNFARFTQKGEVSSLEKARKNIDDAFKTRKDSASYRVNLIRGLVYSSLAYLDSTRKFKYIKDPLDEAMFALDKLKSPKQNDVYSAQIKFIHRQLSNAWLLKAKKATRALNYPDAYQAYLWVDSFSVDKYFARHNLAVLSEKLGHTDQAIKYYSFLVGDKSRAQPEYFLALSNLFEYTRNTNKSLAVIADGRKNFPKQKDLLFKEINSYADNGSYDMVAKLVEQALDLEPENLHLVYLAGFSFESIGKKEKAVKYYKDLLSLEENNYEGNYALGLLYLRSYLKSPEKDQSQLSDSRRYLVQAAEVNPNAEDVLKSLAILYTITGNTTELKRVKNKLGQIF
ncbi:MAG TPA: hypothetical protein VGB63_15035 [Pedobacter sp.]